MATVEQRPETETPVTLTASAADKVRELMAEEPAGEAEVLRVAIQGGGCSGFQYGLGFDRGAVEGDLESEQHGIRSWSTLQRALPPGRDGRLRRLDPGVRVQDREPERDRLVRLRPLLQVEEGEAGDDPHAGGGCGSGCSH